MLRVMFESTKKAEKICQKLLSAPCLDVGRLEKDEIPKHKGIYLWRKSRGGEIVYVGTALGKKGLAGRIVGQHLNPKYMKKGKARSTLRKAVVEHIKNLSPGEKCVDWIKRNLLLSFWPRKIVKTKDVIFSLAEKILIAEEEPRYNKEWRSVQEQRARKKKST